MHRPLFDFHQPDAVPWQPINDLVMGGCSTSTATILPSGGMRFAGRVSLENDGGFASIRCRLGDFNLAGMQRLRLDLQGDGKSYKLSLRCDANFDSVGYQQAFVAPHGERGSVVLELDAFRPFWHGVPRPERGPLDPAAILSFGLLIAERQEGPFELLVHRIVAEG